MKKIDLLTLVFVVLLSGCSKWLDVKPSDRITEDVVFSTPQGFKTALNGIYIELNNDYLYGKELSYGFTDILAQQYAISSENKDLFPIVNSNNYKERASKSLIEQIWITTYKLIANVNKIILKTNENRDVLSDVYYALIRGEALALRAMLHFDMLRLFGPMPSDPSRLSIPYNMEFSFEGNYKEPLGEVISKIIKDYTEAAELLKEHDPILKYGLANANVDVFLNFRNIRINYYAVKALTARVYMYASADLDKKESYRDLAVSCADEVIEKQGKLFPFVSGGMIIPIDNPDRLCSTEIIFGSQNQKIIDAYKFSFSDVISSQSGFYTSNELIIGTKWSPGLFSTDDNRYKSWFDTQREINGKAYRIINKFKVGDNLELMQNQMLPMIRISELYYIKSECKTSVAELNIVRNARGLGNLSQYSNVELENEYKREFYCEGQLFFLYKRLNISSIKTGYSDYHEMNSSAYIIPIPEKETN